jgi:hypothetical protein
MLLVKIKYDEYGYLTHIMPLDNNPIGVRNYPNRYVSKFTLDSKNAKNMEFNAALSLIKYYTTAISFVLNQ